MENGGRGERERLKCILIDFDNVYDQAAKATKYINTKMISLPYRSFHQFAQRE